ncbi:IclR family transcriptional regulator [Acuticoccus sediminis]|uniref:IclR family transcriptional regulator n=1 Tax=Acuticoccus sediminis TaxID=2184697 RepID=A0A8B2NQ27_9HYPH|nr:IclR family transcriptional regulator C-terminal domain-containing protein [Acuticoccus sediminis]RAH99030.1 IclR family transcriptional regulator [Acuticoccus sediminis]
MDEMQSVSRAITTLRTVAETGTAGARVTDVSLHLGLHKASTSRLLASLVSLGALVRGEDRRFRVDADFLATLGAPANQARLRQAARPGLARLTHELQDTSFLSVRSGLDSLCIDRHVGAYPIQALSLDIGSRRPLGVGAGSLALLAWLAEPEGEETLQAQAGRLGNYPHITVEMIRANAGIARGAGVTELPNFVIPGMTGMGAPVRDASGLVVAAISVAAVGDRLSGARREQATALLMEEAAAIGARLTDNNATGRDLGPPQAPAQRQPAPRKRAIKGRNDHEDDIRSDHRT